MLGSFVLQHGISIAMLSSALYQNSEVLEVGLKFAQSIVVYHQNKDSYARYLLSNPA